MAHGTARSAEDFAFTIRSVKYDDPVDGAALVALLDAYARDPMGGGVALPEDVKQRLPSDLTERPAWVSFLAWREGTTPTPIGLVNCMEGYSTFKGKPLLNIHDVVVLPEYRGHGVGRALLQAVEAHGRHIGCCKLTLEVLTGNTAALSTYHRFGFAPYVLDPAAGQATFMQKLL
eukprot:GGOE01043212.1.p1 GENE.GGOE01043212.1~~GGOE01043212.1.p1  ORF type:complete len:175 (+),score=42.11 GGOE01043212.1:72-596(+)